MKNIVNYAKLVKERHALNETIAPVEVDQTDSSRAYAVGDQLIYDGILYDVIDDIAQHGIITSEGAGAKIKTADTIAEQLTDQKSEIEDLTILVGKKLAAQTLAAGDTSLTFSDASITTQSTIKCYVSKYGVAPTDITVTAGQAVLTFDAQQSALSVYLMVI